MNESVPVPELPAASVQEMLTDADALSGPLYGTSGPQVAVLSVEVACRISEWLYQVLWSAGRNAPQTGAPRL